jgi:hypothetical protein
MNKYQRQAVQQRAGSGDAIESTLAESRLREAARRKGCRVTIAQQLPDWMLDRSLLPKRPPGQS